MEFNFKNFSIQQSKSPHKIGTDSLLLGAWTKTSAQRILDIGTGTGVLALMAAQNHPTASITAIEPQIEAFEEAQHNFKQSPYGDRMLAINTQLQNFGTMEKYDLIICNPPYFQNSYKSDDPQRNMARHTDSLLIPDLYELADDLLEEEGVMNVVIPFDLEEDHIHYAAHADLFPLKFLRTLTPKGSFKRSLISFSRQNLANPEEKEMIVKDQNNHYSKAYIKLTQGFHDRDLSQ